MSSVISTCRDARKWRSHLRGGLSAFGKTVLIYGVDSEEVEVPDRTLNIKLVEEGPEGKWDIFEEELKAFGPAVLLIPEEV